MKGYWISLFISLFFVGCQFNSQEGSEETEWALKVADAVMTRHDSLIHYFHPSRVGWQYDVAMLGQVIDRLGNVDKKYSNYNEDYMNYFIDDEGNIKHYRREEYNIDYVNPAKGLITMYKRTGEERFHKAIQKIIVQLEEHPRTNSGGYWHKKRYPYQMWLDGIYMASPFIAQYALEFNQPDWADVVFDQITLIYDSTLDANTGLLYHAWDESREQKWSDPVTGHSPCFWGRSMGWYVMALVDVLDYLPEQMKEREDLVSILKNVAVALLKVQDPETGLWYQVLDQGKREGNYLEASCSAMYIYAFYKGARMGYLDERYLEIAQKAFNSYIETFIFTDDDGMPSIKNICGGTGLGGKPYRDGSYQYYISEKVVINDPKGVAPFIMAAIELGR